MTVIAYRSGVMASDGRITEDNTIVTNSSQKIYKLSSGALFGLAGDADARDLIKLFDKVKTSNQFPTTSRITKLQLDMYGILVLPDLGIWNLVIGVEPESKAWFSQLYQVTDPFQAIGSGAKWAMGAMDRGATALQAVKTAIKFDSQCGGTPQTLKIESI